MAGLGRGPDRTFGEDMVQSTDGGYVGVGWTEATTGDGESDAWVVKLNGTGRAVWNRTLAETSRAVAIVRTPEGGYLVADERGDLLRLDATGHRVGRTSTDVEVVTDLARTPDGGLVVSGSLDTDRGEFPVVRALDEDGSTRWCRFLSDRGWEWGDDRQVRSIATTPDGGVVATGHSRELDLWRLVPTARPGGNAATTRRRRAWTSSRPGTGPSRSPATSTRWRSSPRTAHRDA